MKTELEHLKQTLSEIAGAWNGDEPGHQEERAQIAQEAIEQIEKLEVTLADL